LLSNGGLAGVSGIPGGDLRDVEQAADSGDPDARLALDLFAYEIRKTIGAYAAALGGLDVVSFTGGIGENSPRLRQAALDGLGFLGLGLDPQANRNGRGDRIISPAGSAAKAVVIAANEELVVARETARLLSADVPKLGQ
jgi:acetate kinase